jgi:hypothetical protein
MPRPVAEWFQGPYRVLSGVESLQQRPNPRPGEIIRHRSKGVAILRCPACNALQFYAVEILGSDDAPSFSRPVKCSATACRACGVWFALVAGAVGPCEPPVERERPVPEGLRRHIRPAPRVE